MSATTTNSAAVAAGSGSSASTASSAGTATAGSAVRSSATAAAGTAAAAAKFDASRAGEYAEQSRIALAGYDACHELAACMLAAALGPGRPARILVAGAGGTGQEIITAGRLESGWTFTAVDPAPPMLELAMAHISAAGLQGRTEVLAGTVDGLPAGAVYDAATLIGVLHHIPGDADKLALLRSIAGRLPPGAPFILAGNYRRYADQPLLLAAWRERWRMHGATPAQVQEKLGKIQQGAVPPESEEALAALLEQAGFEAPLRFFASLFWGAWIMRRKPGHGAAHGSMSGSTRA